MFNKKKKKNHPQASLSTLSSFFWLCRTAANKSTTGQAEEEDTQRLSPLRGSVGALCPKTVMMVHKITRILLELQ